VTFGSFNNLSKVSLHTLGLWAEVLRRVPESRLLLKSFTGAEPDNREAVHRYFSGKGIAADRILVEPRRPDVTTHLSPYSEIDIALDTFPYNGATTTCEALWMGVPVVTLTGRTHAARMGCSILSAAGLAGLVTHDDVAYVERAASLAAAPGELASLRSGMR